MNPQLSHHFSQDGHSEIGLRGLFGFLVLLLAPIGLLILVMAVQYQGLQTPVAWDHAQLARNLAAGQGLVTSVVRPLSLSVAPHVGRHPDLYNAPIHSLILAIPFRLCGASDRVAAMTGLSVWVVTVWMTFLLAWRWFGMRVAVIATIFYGTNATAIGGALGGLPYPVVTLWVLAACWAVVPAGQPRERAPAPGGASFIRLRGGRLWLAGVACALAALTNFALGALLVAVLGHVVVTQSGRARAVGWVAGGFLMLLGPWWVWNLFNSQFASTGLGWYDFLVNTKSFPGDSVWRSVALAPVLSTLGRPMMWLHKIGFGGILLFRNLPHVLHPVVGLVCLACLPALLKDVHRRGLALLVLFGMTLTMAGSCVLQADPQLLVVWAPLISILAAEGLRIWVARWIGPFSWRWWLLQPTVAQSVPHLNGVWDELRWLLGMRKTARLVVNGGVVVAAFVPLASFIFSVRPSLQRQQQFKDLQSRLPVDAVVWTDQPAWVAWYAGRTAIELPQHVADFDRVEAAGGTPTAIYMTLGISPRPANAAGDWWPWVSSPHGIFRGLAPVERLPDGTVLRLRLPATTPAPVATELTRLIAEVGQNAQSSDAHYRLAEEYYRLDHLFAAAGEFRTAIQLDEQNTQAILGLWQVLSRRNEAAGGFALAERVAELVPPIPAARPVLEEAAAFLERTGTQARDPWLLLNAVLCHAKLKQWDQAEADYRYIAALVPTIPLRLLLGDLYLQKGLTKQAVTEFQQLVEEQPANAVARQALGLALRANNQLPEALAAFEKATQLRADWPLPYFMAGNTCMQLNDNESAAHFFEKAAQLSPATTRFRFALGATYDRLNDQVRAAKVFEGLLVDDPNNPVLLNNLAVAYAKSGQQLDRALKLIQQAVALVPHNPDIQDSLGLVEIAAGRYADAIGSLQQALQLAPNNSLAHYHLAKALLATGRRDPARTELRAALAGDLPTLEKADALALLAE